jgi:hypothetical protein
MLMVGASTELGMTAKLVGSLGLVLDIVGVCILFKFGFPQPDLDDSIKLVLEESDPDAPKRRKLYVTMSVSGLVCLVAGFALQLLAVWT